MKAPEAIPRVRIGLLLVLSGVLAGVGCVEESEPTGMADILESSAARLQGLDPDTENRPQPSPTPPWPRVDLDERVFDFGRMQMGTTMSHEFVIRNVGEAPLILQAGKPTCQCTSFELSAGQVEPGQAATLHVSWVAKKVTATFSHGGNVYTNDPANPTIKFDVNGMIDNEISLKPDGIWHAGDLASEEPTTVRAKMFSRIRSDLTIDSVSTDSEFTSVEYSPMSAAELSSDDALSGFNFEVTVEPGFPVGILNDKVHILVSGREEPLEVDLQAHRQGSIHVQGMSGTRFNSTARGIDLGQFRAAGGRTAELMLIVNQTDFDEDLQLLDVKTDPGFLRVSLEPIGKRSGTVGRYRMIVEVPRGAPPEKRRKENPGRIDCQTNHPSGEPIELLLHMDPF